MVEGIAEYGRGFKPPSMHELRTWILKAEVDGINLIYEEHKGMEKYGCTIMSDGWTDGKNRSSINFLVNSPANTFFLKSIDASTSTKNGELIFKYLDVVVDEVGEENVIQIVTDNASNCIKVGEKIIETRHRIWWTPYAAHCIDLMLEDIAKLKIFSDTIEHAKMVVKFLYGHGTILSLMRKYTNGKEIVRLAVTRFATLFLTLQSMYKVKRSLEQMFASEDWVSSPLSQTTQGKIVKKIVVNDPNFWSHVAFCVKSVVALIHTKKRNILEHAKLNALVFVKYNFKLRERSIRRRDKIDPIVVDEINSDDEWITEKEGPVLLVTTKWQKMMNYLKVILL
ncbi:uncharacterized protein LOC122048825 [Zingiber officinale]|uniref:uncharacterized protein LOC122048825 n=1 Tax=Zingiber officinale TaxID=94328 RepID=UPI001C4CD890|nr:uncharacterized protein LOC122048825 [Zingiber officinale]